MGRTLYHYCTVETFKKIIENKTFKFSDVTKSNDSKEILLLWEKYYEHMKSKDFNGGIMKFSIETQLNNTVYLALCFTETADSLHMWNCYANEGIAIGFDVDKLEQWTKRICMHVENKDVSNGASIAELRNVTYYSSEQIDEYVENVCKDAKFNTAGFGDIFLSAPFSKSNFFESEKEVRIVLTIIIPSNQTNKFDYVDKNGKFISDFELQSISNDKFFNVLVCYIPFELDMIKSVTIGPNCSLDKSDIIQMLYVNGFHAQNIDIVKSKGSYR